MNGTGDSLCVLIGLWGIKLGRAEGETYLKSPRNVLSFIAISAALGSLVSAVFGVGGLMLGGFAPAERALSIFYTWLLGDMMGVIILFPVIIALRELWALRDQQRQQQQLNIEILMFFAAFAFVLHTLVKDSVAWHASVVWVFVVISMLLWSAFRSTGQSRHLF